MQTLSVGAYVGVVVVLAGCASTVRVPADSHWYSVVAVQRAKLCYEVQVVNANPAGSRNGTSLRLLKLNAFPDYAGLPETMKEAEQKYGKTPTEIRLLDTGPLDLSASGARKTLVVSAGWELLARSSATENKLLMKVHPLTSAYDSECGTEQSK